MEKNFKYIMFLMFIIFLPQTSFADNSYQILINKSTFVLSLVENDKIIAVYPIAVGRGVPGWPSTPEGNFVVENKSEMSCSNWCSPYGTRFMGLYPSHVGIHGTNQPYKIGSPASHGCIRMFNEDVEKLFPKISVGTKVKIFSKPEINKTYFFQNEPITLYCLPTGIDSIESCKIKPLVEKLNSKLIYVDKESLILENEKGYYVNLKVNEPIVYDNNQKEIQLDAPVFIKNGNAFGVVKNFMEILNYTVNEKNEIITPTSESIENKENQPEEKINSDTNQQDLEKKTTPENTTNTNPQETSNNITTDNNSENSDKVN